MGLIQPWVGAYFPVFLPRKSHAQRSLGGYSPKDCKESQMTEKLSTHSRELLHMEIENNIEFACLFILKSELLEKAFIKHTSD